MKIEEQSIGIAVVNKSKATDSVKSVSRSNTEIVLNDLKSLSVHQKVQSEQNAASDDKKHLKVAVDSANKLMEFASYHLRFKIDEDSERLQVSLIDDKTHEIVREIPSQQMLELSARIKELINTINKVVGVFVDEIG